MFVPSKDDLIDGPEIKGLIFAHVVSINEF